MFWILQRQARWNNFKVLMRLRYVVQIFEDYKRTDKTHVSLTKHLVLMKILLSDPTRFLSFPKVLQFNSAFGRMELLLLCSGREIFVFWFGAQFNSTLNFTQSEWPILFSPDLHFRPANRVSCQTHPLWLENAAQCRRLTGDSSSSSMGTRGNPSNSWIPQSQLNIN